ncbi:MAG: DUF885 domain-containing protein, partial [Caulobacter sp.]
MKKIVLAAALAAGATFAMTAPHVLAQPAAAVQSDAVAAFRKIADTEWAWRQKEIPQRGNLVMPDVSAAAQ